MLHSFLGGFLDITWAKSINETNYGYNAANQMTSANATTLTYDHNGNLLGDGANI